MLTMAELDQLAFVHISKLEFWGARATKSGQLTREGNVDMIGLIGDTKYKMTTGSNPDS